MIKILALNESVPLSIDLKVVYVKNPQWIRYFHESSASVNFVEYKDGKIEQHD